MQSKKPIQNTVHTYFFFNDTATTEIYTLSLHDALPICPPDRYSDPPPRCRRPSPPRPVASTRILPVRAHQFEQFQPGQRRGTRSPPVAMPTRGVPATACPVSCDPYRASSNLATSLRVERMQLAFRRLRAAKPRFGQPRGAMPVKRWCS